MNITVVDINKGFIETFERVLNSDFPHLSDSVETVIGSFSEVEDAEAVVSPGNSFGFMTGGIDKAFRDYFGEEVEHRTKQAIYDECLGELNVGSAIMIETDNSVYPFLVYAPTMRVPSVIKGTDSVYRAVWAALKEVFNHNHQPHAVLQIEHLVIPGMGTGAGKMPFEKAAGQMLLAIDNFMNPQRSDKWFEAHKRNDRLKPYI